MFKNIFNFFVIIFVLYVLSVFIFPSFSDNLAKLFKIEHFNKELRIIKLKLDNLYTSLPSKKDIQDTYDKGLSGALQIKDQASDTIKKVKNKIDNTRNTLSGAIESYDNFVDSVNDAKKNINNAINSVNEIKSSFTGVTK